MKNCVCDPIEFNMTYRQKFSFHSPFTVTIHLKLQLHGVASHSISSIKMLLHYTIKSHSYHLIPFIHIIFISFHYPHTLFIHLYHLFATLATSHLALMLWSSSAAHSHNNFTFIYFYFSSLFYLYIRLESCVWVWNPFLSRFILIKTKYFLFSRYITCI